MKKKHSYIDADVDTGAQRAHKTSGKSQKQIGVLGLAALVVSAMVGGGIYNLPQSMASATAASSSAGAQIIAWGITGIGMWFIANTFRILSRVRPNLKNGIYTYAERGFGKFVGFLIAWGYWICNCVALVAYGVMIAATFNFFFPEVFGDGTNVLSIVFASVVTWVMFALSCYGVKSGATINVVGTIAKIIPVLIFVVALITVFQLGVFLNGFWGYAADGVQLSFSFGDVMNQVSGDMMITLFLFTGIEGAVVVSASAKSQKDVSRATVIGFVVVLLLYFVVSILPLGVYGSTTIANMHDPSMAAIVRQRFAGSAFGEVGQIIVNVGVIISVLSSWLVWLLMLAQMPFSAAQDGIFPRHFKKSNKHAAPAYSLFWSTLIIQAGLILSHFMGKDAWEQVVDVSAVMCMPCYMMCCAYLWKVALDKKAWPHEANISRTVALLTGILGTAFALYLLYASGLAYVALALILYAAGIPVFLLGRKEAKDRD